MDKKDKIRLQNLENTVKKLEEKVSKLEEDVEYSKHKVNAVSSRYLNS